MNFKSTLQQVLPELFALDFVIWRSAWKTKYKCDRIISKEFD